MEARQLIADLTAAAAQPTGVPQVGRNCGGLNLPMGGVLSMPNGELVTLTAAAAFKPVCTPVTPPAIIANGGGGSVTIDDNVEGSMPTEDGWTYSDFRDPFYASTFPQCYALAATTVVAYMLVIMLFATPRSFLDGGVVVLGRRGFTHGGSGPTIGGRPWLQKVAALAVAISLTIASAATFAAAEEQYSFGVQNAKRLQMEVLGGNELKIIRIISNTFLWLAQAQTLIRLFPRHREKVIIKWTAFALITLDVIFQSLNSFQYDQGIARPGSFHDAVPALSYLFALSLGVLYAAWVLYYALLKKRYAFWHPQMKNMLLVAVLSVMSVLIPVVFFILDISKPEFTAWGEYVRWVGAAAASVVVWEWVERIEALEREEKKDGILGREVFDEDEMLEMARSNAGLRRRRKGDEDGNKESSSDSGRGDSPRAEPRPRWPAVAAMTARYRPRSRSRRAARSTEPTNTQSSNHDRIRFLQPPLWPARPRPAVTPVSRADTASAASTVYAVRYHPPPESTSRTPPPLQTDVSRYRSNSMDSGRDSDDDSPTEAGDAPSAPSQPPSTGQPPPQEPPPPNRWRALAQRVPFRRGRQPDVERGMSAAAEEGPAARRDEVHARGGAGGQGGGNKWDVRSRLEDFAATQAERLREKFRATPDTDSLPITVIPAPPRPGAALAQLLEEAEERAAVQSGDGGVGSPTRPLGDEPSGQDSVPAWHESGSGPGSGPSVAVAAADTAGTAQRSSVPRAFDPGDREDGPPAEGGRPSENVPPDPPASSPPGAGPPPRF